MESSQQKVSIFRRNEFLEARLKKHMGDAWPVAEKILNRNGFLVYDEHEPSVLLLFEAQPSGLVMHECVGSNSRFETIEKACNIGLQIAKLGELPALFAYTPSRAVEKHIQRLNAEFVDTVQHTKWYRKNVV